MPADADTVNKRRGWRRPERPERSGTMSLSGTAKAKAELSPRQSSQDHVHSGSGFWFLMCSETNPSKTRGFRHQAFLLEFVTSQLRHLAYVKGKNEYIQI